MRPVVQFVAVGLVAALILALLTSWLSRKAAVDEVIADATFTTEVLARSVVQPAMPRGLVDTESASVDKFDRLIRHRVLVGEVLRVKIWDEEGTVIYSDEPRLIGQQFELGDGSLDVLRNGGAEAEVSDVSKAENPFEEPLGQLLEVYTQINSPEGEPLLFEAYFAYDDVERQSEEVFSAFRPITVGGILLFLLLTTPIVWLLARRLSDSATERERLLLIAAQASDAERRRIARDLHDGVVQELAGTSYSLAAAAQDVDGLDASAEQKLSLRTQLESLASTLRQNLRSLRSLLVEIYPPELSPPGLAAALDDLVAPAAAQGTQVTLDVADTSALSQEAVALVWRTAQEAVRNSLRHGHPQAIAIQLSVEPDTVVLVVDDDGAGFDTTATRSPDNFGLRGLTDLAHEAGGELLVTSKHDAGTTVRLEVPRR